MTESNEGNAELLYPLVVCQSFGGPYEDTAFVAGHYLGEIAALLQLSPLGLSIERYVPTNLVPQLDLVAMHHGMQLDHEPWEDHPEDWTWIRIAPATTLEEPEDLLGGETDG